MEWIWESKHFPLNTINLFLKITHCLEMEKSYTALQGFLKHNCNIETQRQYLMLGCKMLK